MAEYKKSGRPNKEIKFSSIFVNSSGTDISFEIALRNEINYINQLFLFHCSFLSGSLRLLKKIMFRKYFEDLS